MSTKPTKKKRHPLVRFVLFLWIGLMAFSVFLVILFVGISSGMLGKLPDIVQLENPQTFLASEVYSQDSVLLGKYYYENRSNANFEDLSPNLLNALVATEDNRFYKHSGIDVRGLLRVFFKTVILRNSSSGGGSTITQQLALNLFTDARASTLPKRITQKLKEWVIAIQLEKRYTKEEIITMYLNTVQFSGNSYGIKSAAKTFFNTTPDKLTIEQAAVLVGVLKAISKYNPKLNPENSFSRRNTVMFQMKRYGYLSSDKYDSLKQLPIELNYQSETHNEGMATYFREYLRQYLTAHEPKRDDYVDRFVYDIDKYYWDNNPYYGWVTKNTKPDGSHYDLYRDGLRIYVTLDSRLQHHAEMAVEQHMQSLQKKFNDHWKNSAPWGTDKDFIPTAIKRTERYRLMKSEGLSEAEIKKSFTTKTKMRVYSYHGEIDTVMTPEDSVKYYKYFAQTGFMSMDPKNGAIKAWVGGINHTYFKYDHVNIHATRQVGSTFKPFVYTKYVSETKDICKKMPNTRTSIILDDGTVWEPQNSDGKETESEPLWRALALSMNNVTVNIMKQLDPNAPKVVRQTAQSMGIKNKLEDVYSICLGVSNLSVYEMVGAFATFANKGYYTEPYFVARITDKTGTVITGNVMPATHEAMNEKTAFLMLKMMQRVTTGGTGTRLRSLYGIDYNIPVAGKTGTTQNNSDGWFIGVTPDLVSGAWVGWDDMKIHFRSTDLGQGAAMALPIFAYYMKDVYADPKLHISKGDFEKPKDTDGLVFDCKKEAEDEGDELKGIDLFDR
jgi:penicillin-binding protein 1A